MDNSTHLALLQGHGLMAQDKIIAIQQECEEICLQSDTPDYLSGAVFQALCLCGGGTKTAGAEMIL